MIVEIACFPSSVNSLMSFILILNDNEASCFFILSLVKSTTSIIDSFMQRSEKKIIKVLSQNCSILILLLMCPSVKDGFGFSVVEIGCSVQNNIFI